MSNGKKRILIILILSLIFILGYEFKSFLGFNDISISLNTPSYIRRKQIKIYKGWYSQSDTLLPTKKGKLIFDGQKFLRFETDYGENDYLIIYSDSCYTKFRHFKTTNRMYDIYSIYVSKLNGKLIIKAKIKGTDPIVLTNNFQRK